MNITDLPQRIASKIVVGDGCWQWLGAPGSHGYGEVSFGRGSRQLVHRYIYEQFVGPIPDGLVIDHACHNADPNCPGRRACTHKRCVNPAHLRVVTPVENIKAAPNSRLAQNIAKTSCDNGHEYTDANTIWRNRGCGIFTRQCRECSRQASRIGGKRRRAQAVPPASSALIRQRMKAAHITQDDLGRMLGISQAGVSNRLLGFAQWKPGEMDAVADILGLDLAGAA